MVRSALTAAGLACLALTGAGGQAVARQVVSFTVDVPPGTIVISQRERRLYLTLGEGRAIRYPVAVGKVGKVWSGWARIDAKHVNPAWSPPAVVRRDNPHLPDMIPGGSPSNPMGPRALTLDLPEIAIHGTTEAMRRSIGTAASYGCIRMLNEDILDLFDRVQVGTAVVAIP
jgi:lipoprotein-anchoring transpeptidase ErfK/SrfK